MICGEILGNRWRLTLELDWRLALGIALVPRSRETLLNSHLLIFLGPVTFAFWSGF